MRVVPGAISAAPGAVVTGRSWSRSLPLPAPYRYDKVRRMIWDLTDIISTTRLINHLFGELCAAPAKTCSPVATECAYANTSCVCGVAEIPNHSEPARRRGCRLSFKFERADMLRKRSAG